MGEYGAWWEKRGRVSVEATFQEYIQDGPTGSASLVSRGVDS